MGNARPIASGVLVILGLALVANQCGSSRIPDAGPTTVAALHEVKGGPRLVSLPGAMLDWQNRRWRSPKTDAFYAHDPRDVATIADPAELIARRGELLGRFVRMTSAPEPKNWFYLVKKSPTSSHIERTATSLYVPVEGANGAAWIISEQLTAHDDPKSKEFLARRSHVGLVKSIFDVYDGTLLASEYGKHGGRGIPPTAVALDTEKPPPPDAALDTWAPVTGSKNDVWVAIEGTPADPPASIAGVVERVQNALLDAEIGRIDRIGSSYATRRVIWLGDEEAFRATHRDYERVSIIGLVLLAAGGGLLLAHLLLRRLA